MEIKAASFKELRKLYGMSWYTFNKYISPIRRELDIMVHRRKYQNLIPKQVKRIVEFIGEP